MSTAKAASALTGLARDETQQEAMAKADKADGYLLELGKAYLEAGDEEKAGATFKALREKFPESTAVKKIPEGH